MQLAKDYRFLPIMLDCAKRFLFILSLILLHTLLFAQEKMPFRELRGVWIATVKNIDFPSKTQLSTEEQQQELIDLLDFHQKNGINAVFFQIRPATDAFYASHFEPWSEWLNGKSGKAPNPFYDPLAFMITECRKRAMEFHAWFNPYRALVDVDLTRLANHKLSKEHPEWFLQYGKNLYFDPGLPEVRNYVTQVILDVVQNYDIDAVHFDDYFYPYRIKDVEFPDSLSFEKYKVGFQNKADWRRNNVDMLIQNLNEAIKKTKPHVKLGISPFGVWRNIAQDSLGSNTKAGQTCYDDLYADVRKWLEKGWIDYIAPQIYFSIGYPPADYQILLDWWRKNSFGKHLYIGQAAYKIKANADSNWFNPAQIPNQILLNRKSPEVQGSIYFSAKSFKSNPLGINTQLQNKLYRFPALIHGMPWLKSNEQITDFQVKFQNQFGKLNLNFNGTKRDYLLIYRFKGKKTGDLSNPANIAGIIHSSRANFLDKNARKRKKYTYYTVVLDRLWNESQITQTTTVKLKGQKKLRIY